MRSSIPTVQLHRPPMIPSLNTKAAQEVCPLPHKDSEPRSPGNSQCSPKAYQSSQSTHSFDRSGASSLPIMHSPVAPHQVKFLCLMKLQVKGFSNRFCVFSLLCKPRLKPVLWGVGQSYVHIVRAWSLVVSLSNRIFKTKMQVI